MGYPAFAAAADRITALVVRRAKDARYPDALFPVWRYHPFFTNTEVPTAQANIVDRRDAVIGTVFADLIDGPLAHMPPGFSARIPLGSWPPHSRITWRTPPAPSPAADNTVAAAR